MFFSIFLGLVLLSVEIILIAFLASLIHANLKP